MVPWWWLLVLTFGTALVCFLVIGALHGKSQEREIRRQIREINAELRQGAKVKGGWVKFDGRKGSLEFIPLSGKERSQNVGT